jgi:tetratricopeptide (TPR) repeat protein
MAGMSLRNLFRRKAANVSPSDGSQEAAARGAREDAPPSRQTGVHPLLPQAVALHQAGRLEKAAGLYEAILRDTPHQFDAAHMLGVVAMQEGRLGDAQRQIEFALKIKPNDQSALINLTAAYLRDGKLEAAAECGEKTARLAPDSIDALINYGFRSQSTCDGDLQSAGLVSAQDRRCAQGRDHF